MRYQDIAAVIFVLGLSAQGYGIYQLWGPSIACLVIGVEFMLIGLVGSLRAG